PADESLFNEEHMPEDAMSQIFEQRADVAQGAIVTHEKHYLHGIPNAAAIRPVAQTLPELANVLSLRFQVCPDQAAVERGRGSLDFTLEDVSAALRDDVLPSTGCRADYGSLIVADDEWVGYFNTY